MKILILNKEIKDNTFLKSQFEIDNFANLIIGKKSYIETFLESLDCFDSSETKIVFSDASIESFSALANFLQYRDINPKSLDADVDIFYYDLSLFPKNTEKLSNIFNKSLYSQNLVLFYEKNSSKEKSYLPIYKFKASFLNENLNNESQLSQNTHSMTDIDLSEELLSLNKTNDILQLFSNNFQLRFFNHISSDKDYFVKSSSKKDKMLAEFNFLSNIPSELKPFYPQIGKHEEKKDSASYQIEKIYMFDLSKLLINRVLNKRDVLAKLLDKLKDYINRSPYKKITKEDFKASLKKNFIDKNEERFNETEKLTIYGKLNQLSVFLGYQSAKELHQMIQKDIQDFIDRSKETSLYFSHGDLCFSNILFDPHSFALKLIDPRGFQENIDESFRPIYYDLAKLSHSFLGLYDLIIYDLVDINFDENANLGFKHLIEADYIQMLSDSFTDFVSALGYDIKLIRLFEASLFMSMIPLHKDGNKKMLAQFIQAAKSYQASKNTNNILEEKGA